MTMPDVDRRSPVSPSTETRTRSWSMRIGRRAAAAEIPAPGAIWVTWAGYPRLGPPAPPDDDDHEEQDDGGGRGGDPLVPGLALLVRHEADGPLPGVVRGPAGDLLRVGADDELVDGLGQAAAAVVHDLLDGLGVLRKIRPTRALVSSHAGKGRAPQRGGRSRRERARLVHRAAVPS